MPCQSQLPYLDNSKHICEAPYNEIISSPHCSILGKSKYSVQPLFSPCSAPCSAPVLINNQVPQKELGSKLWSCVLSILKHLESELGFKIHRISGFLDLVHRPVFKNPVNTTFREMDLFPSSGEDRF
jgi:hypothetical protein